MYKRILLRLAPIQLLLLMAVSCTPEATAPLFDSDVESTANHKGDGGDFKKNLRLASGRAAQVVREMLTTLQ